MFPRAKKCAECPIKYGDILLISKMSGIFRKFAGSVYINLIGIYQTICYSLMLLNVTLKELECTIFCLRYMVKNVVSLTEKLGINRFYWP